MQPRFSKRAFTIIELTVVIAIISIMALIISGTLAVIMVGDPLTSSTAQVRGLIDRGRAKSIARNARFELLVDFHDNAIVSFERQPISFYGFEDGERQLAAILNLESGAAYEGKRQPRREGRALGLAWDSNGGSANISYVDDFSISTKDAGISISMEVYVHAYQYGNEEFNLISRGEDWKIRVKRVQGGVCTFSAEAAGQLIEPAITIPTYTWGHLELVVSSSHVAFYVDGIPTTSNSDYLSDPPPPGTRNTSNITIGDSDIPPMMIDNLRLERLNVGGRIAFEDTQLVPVGLISDESEAAAIRLERLTSLIDSGASGVDWLVDGVVQTTPPIDGAGPQFLEVKEFQRRALMYFDQSGNLDQYFHKGPVSLLFVHMPNSGEPKLRKIEIGVSGVIRDSWEELPKLGEIPAASRDTNAAPPDQAPAESSGDEGETE